jgi:hypothetical protein
MAQLWNMARMTSTTTGTSTVTLGAAVSGYNTFTNAGVVNGSCVAYGIMSSDGSAREMGLGVYSSLTLTRVPTASTAGGAAINLTGTSEVFVTPAHQQLGNKTENNTWLGQQTFFSTAASYNPIFLEGDSTDAAVSPIVYLHRAMTPADGQYLGRIHFSGFTAGSSFISYAQVTARVITASSSSPDGALIFGTLSSGVETERIYIGQGLYTVNSTDKGPDSVSAALLFASSAIQSNSPTAGVGYTVGAGSCVTQVTAKTCAVTLNTMCGNIITSNAALASATTVSFTLNSSGITGSDIMIINHFSGGTFGAYSFTTRCLSSGVATINLRNLSSISLSEALTLRFAVIKAALS